MERREFYQYLIKTLVEQEMIFTYLEKRVEEITGTMITDWPAAKTESTGFDLRGIIITVIDQIRYENGKDPLDDDEKELLYAQFDESELLEATLTINKLADL